MGHVTYKIQTLPCMVWGHVHFFFSFNFSIENQYSTATKHEEGVIEAGLHTAMHGGATQLFSGFSNIMFEDHSKPLFFLVKKTAFNKSEDV